MIDNTALVLDSAGNWSLYGQISGSGSVSQISSGIVTLLATMATAAVRRLPPVN